MNLSSPFILRPIGTSLMIVALLFAGLIAYQLLPVSALPQVDYPIIRVSTFYPGASPEVMTSLITAPLERQLGQIPGLNQMSSISSSGSSLITLQFALTLSLDIAEQDVQAAINAASNYLPAELPNPPIYSKVNPADSPIITLALSSSTLTLPQIEDYAETHFAQKIAQVSGVGLVTISGGQRPAIRIEANAQALAAHQLTLEDLRQAIAQANINQAKGELNGPSLSYTINSNDQLNQSSDYQSLIIAYNNGAPIRLNEVAHVIDGAQNIKQAAWINETPAILLSIQRQPGANIIKVVDQIKELIPKVSKTLPRGLNVQLINDRTDMIRASVTDAMGEMCLSVGLVVLVMLLFLRNGAATFISSVAVPISLIGTFAAMYLLNFSINNLTLMALTIATGFVVDDAIVMIENITRMLEKGLSPLEAALKGAKQIGFTIISLTIALIAVMIPLLFMSDVVGRLFREFALTLSMAIGLSALISLTFTPMLCGLLLKTQKKPADFLEKTIEFYAHSLKLVLAHQKIMLLVTAGTLVLTGLLVLEIPKGFFPQEDIGVIQAISQAPQSISFPAMTKRQQALTAMILKHPAIANVTSSVGIDGFNSTLNTGQLQLVLKPRSERTQPIMDIIDDLARAAQSVEGISLYMQPLQDIMLDDRISQQQYQVSIGSPNAQDVDHWSDLMMKKLMESKVLQEVTSDRLNLGLETRLQIDRDKASSLGVSMQAIDDILYDAFGQRQISTIFTQLNQYYVILSLDSSFESPLDQLYVTGSSGAVIPLNSLIRVTQGVGSLSLNRQGQFPVVTLSFNLAPQHSLGEAVDVVKKAQRDLAVPESVQINFEGAAKTFQGSLANEGWLVLAAVVVVYLILGILYESLIHPITILSTLPSAAVGALLALRITGCELTVVALIGIILLIGIVMKNAIMMIDFALELERNEHKSAADAIYEACLLRFRPILMTSCAALLGAVPLALGSGMGSELRQPLGIAIIGGLIVSQLLTLYTTPVIYLTFDALALRMRNIR